MTSTTPAPIGSFKPIYVMGADPGFANFGLAIIAIGPNPVDDRVVHVELVRTEPSGKKRKVRASDDNIDRTQKIAKRMDALLQQWNVRAVAAEAMSPVRSASAAAKICLSYGVLGTLTAIRGIALAQVSPQALKQAVCGQKDASKDEIAATLNLLYRADLVGPNSVWKDAGVPESLKEHPYDAIGAVVACHNADVFLLLRRMISCEASTESSSRGTSPSA